jgi:Leucine-rich repeat (LRR) protein
MHSLSFACSQDQDALLDWTDFIANHIVPTSGILSLTDLTKSLLFLNRMVFSAVRQQLAMLHLLTRPPFDQRTYSKIGRCTLLSSFENVTFSQILSSTTLRLFHKKLNDPHLQILAAALSRGAFPLLKHLHLECNEIGDAGISALADASANGTLLKLKTLRLSYNRIGDVGFQAFVSALCKEALPQLKELYLQRNQISNTGLLGFAEALSGGALPLLKKLFVDSDWARPSDENFWAVCKARRMTVATIDRVI